MEEVHIPLKIASRTATFILRGNVQFVSIHFLQLLLIICRKTEDVSGRSGPCVDVTVGCFLFGLGNGKVYKCFLYVPVRENKNTDIKEEAKEGYKITRR